MEKIRTLKRCPQCGQPFARGAGTFYCETCSKEIRNMSTIRERSCKICGKTFDGGPRAFYCQECRIVKRRENAKRCRDGSTPGRKLGSVDCCQSCGKEYIIRSARQKYCEQCKDAEGKRWQREHKKMFPQDTTHRDELRAAREKVCMLCGRSFQTKSTTNTCSEECRILLKKIRVAKGDYVRGKRTLESFQEYEKKIKESRK